jgi:hypothetical protein
VWRAIIGLFFWPKFYEKSNEEANKAVDCRTFAKLIPKTPSLVTVKILVFLAFLIQSQRKI